jgi:hypothetical protein
VSGAMYVVSESPIPGSVRVLKSIDNGATWVAAANGLPDVPIGDVREDPRDPSGQSLYVATGLGVYRTSDGGTTWSLFGAGLPTVRTSGLWVSADGRTVRVATYGRGAWEISPWRVVSSVLVGWQEWGQRRKLDPLFAQRVGVFARRLAAEGRSLGQVNTRSWRNALKRAGIKNFRWHDLRHVWATWHVMAGTTMAELQELGAWKSALMVKRYAHFAPEQLRAAADAPN